MKKVNFLFGVHCHQPIGNFEHVFEEVFEKAYFPFLTVMESHPRIKFAVHYSGVLYDWFREKRPEFMELLKKLVRRGQVEVLTSGYYEPILSIIPEEDKLGQIEMSNQFIKQSFGRAPRGMWLTGQVWEPSLAGSFSRAGIEYVMVDGNHFASAGLSSDGHFGYYMTEEQGEALKIFPINENLRRLIPYRSPEEVLEYLKSIASKDGEAAAIVMDDGEKFGERDGSHERIYKKNYLESLLSQLEKNAEWIKFISFSDYLDEYSPRGRIYLPSASYPEMKEWSGGYFRNFLVRYPEANHMHKKMLQVSSRLSTLRRGKTLFGEKDRESRLKKAVEELYKGQCNSPYWHGTFGGLYLNYLRHAVYSHLIRSEAEMEKFSRGGKPYVELAVTDFDRDGRDEVILSNDLLNLYFAPAYGGALFELDYKPKAFNLVNTLARRKEAYHRGHLAYDRHQRYSLMDHFLARDTDLEKFSSASHTEIGDFANRPYSFMPRRKALEAGLILSREGRVEGIPLKVEKTISLLSKQSIIDIEYNISNQGKEPDEFRFGIEFNFSMLAGNAKDRYYLIKNVSLEDNSLASKGETDKISFLKIVDDWSGFEVSLETSRPALLWRFPIETLSRSENGVEKNFQSSVVFPSWKFRLEPKQAWKVKITLRIEE